MIIDYEEFQELLQQRREMDRRDWYSLLDILANGEDIDSDRKFGNRYRVIAAIVLLHRRYGSWERLTEELTNRYPSVNMKSFQSRYGTLEKYNDKNIRKIGNRLSLNDLITIMLWLDHWSMEREDKHRIHRLMPPGYHNVTMCALNRMVNVSVKSALGLTDGVPLNVSTMDLDGIIAMMECLGENEWDNQQFCYISGKNPGLEESLLVLEAMGATVVEMSAGQYRTTISVFKHYNRLFDEKMIDGWFDQIVRKPLELLTPDGQLALVLDADWLNNPVVQKFLYPYVTNSQIRCIFNIPSTECAEGRYYSFKLPELRCIVFSNKSVAGQVQVVDFSDLLTGKDYNVFGDEQILEGLQNIIQERFNGNGKNTIFVDKDFFLNQGNAYDPYYCNSILYMEKMQQEGKYISLEQLMGKAELPEKVITDGIAVPEMISVFRPVAMKQLERAKKRSAMDEGKTNGADVMVYTVTAKHIRDGVLFVKNGELESTTLGSDKMDKIQRYILQPGDLLVSRIGTPVIGLVTEEDLDGRLLLAADSLHIIRCDAEVIQKQQPIMNTRFMYMYLFSQVGKRQLASLVGKGRRTVNYISLQELSKLFFPADAQLIKNVTEKWYQINEARKVIDDCFAECDKLLRI